MVIAKFRQVALVLRAGKVTLPYPAEPHAPAEGFRGLPAVDGELCLGCGGCAHVCPARLFTLTYAEDRLVLAADFTRCTYCGRCQDVCPTGACRMTDRFETATADRRKLTLRVELALVSCSRCGKPVASQHMAAYVAARVGAEQVDPALAQLCAECRRIAYGARLRGGTYRG